MYALRPEEELIRPLPFPVRPFPRSVVRSHTWLRLFDRDAWLRPLDPSLDLALVASRHGCCLAPTPNRRSPRL